MSWAGHEELKLKMLRRLEESGYRMTERPREVDEGLHMYIDLAFYSPTGELNLYQAKSTNQPRPNVSISMAARAGYDALLRAGWDVVVFSDTHANHHSRLWYGALVNDEYFLVPKELGGEAAGAVRWA